MKKFITSLCLGLMFIVGAFSESKADTYYVMDGQSFTLTPQVPVGTIFSKIQWTVDGVLGPALTNNVGALVSKFDLPAGTKVPVEHVLKLGVVSDALGCLSDLVTHTIVVLPKVSLTIKSDNDNFCAGLVDATLSVELDVTLASLAKYNIALTPFGWAGPDGISSVGQTLKITKVGSYTVSADYIITNIVGDGILVPTATKIIGVNAINTGTKIITEAAKVIVPALTFQ